MLTKYRCKWLPIRKGYDYPEEERRGDGVKVANGFRFGRVTTFLMRSHALDIFVANGFRFGRVTTNSVFIEQEMAFYVANGFRFGRVTTHVL